MSTEFSYWYLRGTSFPDFEKGDKPKEYLQQWFANTRKPKGEHPLNADNVEAVEFLEAGLAAGYGKETTWSRTLLMHKAERASLYNYLRWRLQSTYECLDVAKDGITLKSFWRGIEPSEKGGLSFAIGSVAALLGARRWVKQFGASRTVKRFLHARVFVDPAIVRHPVGTPQKDGDSMPDFLVEDSSNEWHVFEAKGGDQGNRWKQLAQGLQQAKGVKLVGLVGALRPPKSAVCVQTVVSKDVKLELTLVDPPAEVSNDAVDPAGIEIAFLPELLELSIILDAVEWFHCLRDLPMPGDPALLTSLRGHLASGRSLAFGGLLLALPREYLDFEDDIREAARTLTTLARLSEELDGLDLTDVAEESVQRLASAARGRLNIRRFAKLYDIDALRQIGDLGLSNGEVSKRDGWLAHVVNELRVGNFRIVELVAKLSRAREEATAEFLRRKVADSRPWASMVVTSGGMAVWMEGSDEEKA